MTPTQQGDSEREVPAIIQGEIHEGGSLSIPDGPMAAWLEDRFEEYGDLPGALVWEDDGYTERTFSEVYEESRQVAGGLLEAGLEPGDRVGVRSTSRYEWSLIDVASHLAGLILVPVYPEFSADQAVHVVEDAEVQFLATETPYPDDLDDAVPEVVEIDALPEAEPDELPGFEIDETEPATIIYTSGTTGMPKGCTITHHNLLAAAAMVATRLPLDEGSVGTCFLPLSHIYQRAANYYMYERGSAPAYMSVEHLQEQLQLVEPELLVTVPRVYRRVYAGIQDQVAEMSGLKKSLVEWADGVARRYGEGLSEGETVSTGLRIKHSIADKLVLSTFREELGLTNVTYALTGAASIDGELLHFFWGMGVPLVEVYGSTEVTGPSTMNKPDSFRAGTVGYPMDGSAVAIASDGEVLFAGPNVMEGYWNNEEATEESFTDGWYHTGDIGEFDEDGFLQIIDRKKNMAVLDTGENVSPDAVETALTNSRYVTEAMAIADDRKFVTALIQPNYEALLTFARENDIEFDESATVRDDNDEITSIDEVLVNHSEVRDLLETEVETANEELANYATVGDFTLLHRGFSMEREELTPTLKKRRPTIMDHFEAEIEAMYE